MEPYITYLVQQLATDCLLEWTLISFSKPIPQLLCTRFLLPAGAAVARSSPKLSLQVARLDLLDRRPGLQ